MCQPGNDAEIIAMLFEQLQIRRRRIVPPRLLREEIRRVQSEWRADADHPADGALTDRGQPTRLKIFEHRQCHANAGSAKEVSATDVHGADYFWRNSSLWTTTWTSERKP